MTLFIRMILYAISSFVAGYGFAEFDAGSGTLTLNIEQFASILSGAAVFIATFVGSRIAKSRGGKT